MLQLISAPLLWKNNHSQSFFHDPLEVYGGDCLILIVFWEETFGQWVCSPYQKKWKVDKWCNGAMKMTDAAQKKQKQKQIYRGKMSGW